LKNPPTTRGQPAIAHGVTTSTSTRLLQTCESLVKEYASVERAIGMVAKQENGGPPLAPALAGSPAARYPPHHPSKATTRLPVVLW
jgi:hypothetical protein